MNITGLDDLILLRSALMLLAQCSKGESRARTKKILAIAAEEIRIKSILKASGAKSCVGSG